jgi:hypothetical protein
MVTCVDITKEMAENGDDNILYRKSQAYSMHYHSIQKRKSKIKLKYNIQCNNSQDQDIKKKIKRASGPRAALFHTLYE